ncbi:MAG: hypothetical protein ACRYGP_05790, partial [Janthinobacterium lividum]
GPTNEDEVADDVIEDVEEPGDADEKPEGKTKGKGKKAGAKDEDDGDQDADADADDKDDVDAESKDDKEQAAYQRGLAMGRVRENKRCSRIFLTAAAAGRPDVAATIAFTTRNTSAEAGRLMGVVGAAALGRRSASLDDRMGARTDARPGAGGAGGAGGEPSFGQRVAAAVAKTGRKA